MKWPSYIVIAGFLVTTNILVHANLDTSALQQYTQIPAEVNNLADRVQPAQLDRLPVPAQREFVSRITGLQDKARQTLLDSNPLANGQLPTSLPSSSALPGLSSSLPSGTLPSTALPMSAAGLTGGNVGQNASTPASNSARAVQLGSIDPLGATANSIGTQRALSEQNDIATLTTGNAREIRAFAQYYKNTSDKVELLSSSYVQLKSVFSSYEDKLDEMLDKLPATVANCVRVP